VVADLRVNGKDHRVGWTLVARPRARIAAVSTALKYVIRKPYG
jgi:hypothetical protein